MLNAIRNELNTTYTENGAVTNKTSGNECLDLFFKAGALRFADDKTIAEAVLRAFAEDPVKTLRIIFFARDIRGGLGERNFFRAAVKALAKHEPDAIIRNIPYFAEFGRYDDLCCLLGTDCESAMVEEIRKQLALDSQAMREGKSASLLAKWLPSVNASSKKTRADACKLVSLLGMSEPSYRKLLSSLRRYTDIIENRLREKDYTFDYEKQTSRALFKYRAAFLRNDNSRYTEYIESVQNGTAKMNASTLFPYDIVRSCFADAQQDERDALDAAWKSLPDHGSNSENALAVVDCSGSMTWAPDGHVAPIDVSVSLGIYFAEHCKGTFANHFITFSEEPQLIEIKGKDIYEKARYCRSFDDPENTDIEAVFRLLLNAAVKNKLPQSEMPSRIYIISDMEFDYCIEGGNDDTVFRTMQEMYKTKGYKLPDVVFWNVNARTQNIPITLSDTGAALVSGFSPVIFDMALEGDLDPARIMDEAINSERYSVIC